jgi:plasmid maintenance system antidote protein VapI
MGRPMGSSNSTPLPAHPLLDQLKWEFALSSDGQLCDFLKVSRSTMSKIRHGINSVSADLILRVHKTTGWPVDRIESYL